MPSANHELYQDAILKTPSPSFTIEQVRDIANKLYGLSGNLFPLPSERDQNLLRTAPRIRRSLICNSGRWNISR